MALNPALRDLLATASAKGKPEPARGIVPFQEFEIDPRDALICDVAAMISEAMTGPAIGVWELATMIVDTVEEAA